jgi:hypothetical protein
MREVFVFALLAGFAVGETAPEAAEIGKIRENIRIYLDQLSRITCTEDTRQTVRIAGARSTETRQESCDTRQYKLFAVQQIGVLGGRAYEPSRTSAASDWRDRLREASLTTCTGFLAALVDPRMDAGFRWLRMARANWRAVSVYVFHAPMPQGFLLVDSKGSVHVPFKGLLYADAATGALVRVEIECIEIPPESEYIGADIIVDFSLFDVAGRSIVLPSHAG